jgi:hypothetical protein
MHGWPFHGAQPTAGSAVAATMQSCASEEPTRAKERDSTGAASQHTLMAKTHQIVLAHNLHTRAEGNCNERQTRDGSATTQAALLRGVRCRRGLHGGGNAWARVTERCAGPVPAGQGGQHRHIVEALRHARRVDTAVGAVCVCWCSSSWMTGKVPVAADTVVLVLVWYAILRRLAGCLCCVECVWCSPCFSVSLPSLFLPAVCTQQPQAHPLLDSTGVSVGGSTCVCVCVLVCVCVCVCVRASPDALHFRPLSSAIPGCSAMPFLRLALSHFNQSTAGEYSRYFLVFVFVGF